MKQECNQVADEINDFVCKTFDALSAENFNIPAYTLETRNCCLNIFDFFVDNLDEFYITKLRDFLEIVLDGIDGEKDPRNILVMFALIQKISKKYFLLNSSKYDSYLDEESKKDLAKSFFDSLEIYYPIEFTPPKNSQDKITVDDLINSLNACFASSDLYMEFLIEVLEGK